MQGPNDIPYGTMCVCLVVTIATSAALANVCALLSAILVCIMGHVTGFHQVVISDDRIVHR